MGDSTKPAEGDATRRRCVLAPKPYPIGTQLIVMALLLATLPLACPTPPADAGTQLRQVTPKQGASFIAGSDHEVGTDNRCGKCMEWLKLAAATAESADEAGEEKVRGDRLADTVLKVGEIISEGNPDKARDVLRAAIRHCESGEADEKECFRWKKTLRALDQIWSVAPARKAVTNSIGMKLVRVPPGEYMMGSVKQEIDWLRLTFKKIWREGHKQWYQDELPLHPVRITKAFYMGATEVTVGQFREFFKASQHKTEAETGDGGMIFSTKENRWVAQKNMKWNSVPWEISDNQPVVFVSWNDAQEFCRWLSRKEKRTYRLPTEAEWEMACRGGSPWIRYPWGNRLPGDRDSNFSDESNKLPKSLLTVNDGHKYVAPVGSYPANGYGLHDMAGNVMEWVQDRYQRDYYESSPLEDPQGPATGTSRTNKGGNWFASPADDRCAFRGFSGPAMSFWNLGFRVVMEDPGEEGTLLASKNQGSDSRTGRDEKTPDLPPGPEEALNFFRQAMFGAQQQQWEDAIRDLEKALEIYERREDYKWVARVRATLAGIYAERNRPHKSKELYGQALADFRKIGDLTSARLVLGQLQELETSHVVRVVQVRTGSPASKAGVVPGDTIIEYAGETGFRVDGFKKLVDDYVRADKVTLSVMNNEEITTHVVPGGELGVAVENIRRPPRPRRPTVDAGPRDARDRQRPPRRRDRPRDRR